MSRIAPSRLVWPCFCCLFKHRKQNLSPVTFKGPAKHA
jgi:hypothetical protein